MAPVVGLATLVSCWSSRTLLLIVVCNALFTIFSYNVSAARIYDRGTLLYIKDSMDSYCDSWDNFRKVFPPPLVSSAPECLLQCTTHGTLRPKKRRRGTMAGVRVKQSRYRRLPSWLWRDSRCMRPVPLQSFGVDPAPPSVAQVPWLSVGVLAWCPSSVLHSAGGGAVPVLKNFYCILIYRPPGIARAFLSEFNNLLSSIIKLEKTCSKQLILLSAFDAVSMRMNREAFLSAPKAGLQTRGDYP
ncbi:hypothetical protein XENOCAPTIV_007692 [Xenoophorus captivus]|uniref:Uncharacterized protein n=1 Tax=Xenoophorus captivus TaxID=1517983 RepID=A0ABV0QDT4_9TELE